MAGRPRKVGLDYFSHDVDLSDDDKVQAVEAKYGADGYTVYLKLLERIYRAGGPIEVTPILVAIITRVLRENEDYLREMLAYMCEIGLISKTKRGELYSDGALKRLNWVQRKRGMDRDLAAFAYYHGENAARRGDSIAQKKIREDLSGERFAHAASEVSTKKIVKRIVGRQWESNKSRKPRAKPKPPQGGGDFAKPGHVPDYSTPAEMPAAEDCDP